MAQLRKNVSKHRQTCSVGCAGDDGDRASRRLHAAGRSVVPVRQRRSGSRSPTHLLLIRFEYGRSIFSDPDGSPLIRDYPFEISDVFDLTVSSDTKLATQAACAQQGLMWSKPCPC